jgi:hypothetical protein
MIDKTVYAQHMALLETWFVTDLTDMESIALYEALSQNLSTEEFAGACKYFFQEIDKGYPGNFPCARKFIDAARGDQKARALKLWVRLLADVRANKGNEFERKSTQVIQDAIAAIGGIQVVVNTPDQDLKWLKKDFIDALLAFKQMETRQNYLPKSENKSQLLPTVED